MLPYVSTVYQEIQSILHPSLSGMEFSCIGTGLMFSHDVCCEEAHSLQGRGNNQPEAQSKDNHYTNKTICSV